MQKVYPLSTSSLTALRSSSEIDLFSTSSIPTSSGGRSSNMVASKNREGTFIKTSFPPPIFSGPISATMFRVMEVA